MLNRIVHTEIDTVSQVEDGANAVFRSSKATASGPQIHQSAIFRLYLRGWLVVLMTIIIMSLVFIYRLPWHAAAYALAAFTAGAAFIPRAGILPQIRPIFIPSDHSNENDVFSKIMIDAIPEPSIILTRDGAISSFNHKAFDLFEGLREGTHISAALRNPKLLDAVAAAGHDHKSQTVIFTDRVPVERHIAVTVSFLNPKGITKQAAILLYLKDLTEQHRVDQLRSDFIANASHEIKTPLASLLGFIETLQGAAKDDTEARERFLGIMAKQAQRMARLIDNLMSLSRVQMRAHLKPQDRIEISELVRQACDALEPMAAEACIKLRMDLKAEQAMVLGDKDELTQVFINLIHNAIKYGNEGGAISVSTFHVKDEATPRIGIAITDNGPGIAAQHLPRLTERFYRVLDTSTFEKGGTGLGLAIVKHVVNRHRGELRITSSPSVGSTFTVILTEDTHSLEYGDHSLDRE